MRGIHALASGAFFTAAVVMACGCGSGTSVSAGQKNAVDVVPNPDTLWPQTSQQPAPAPADGASLLPASSGAVAFAVPPVRCETSGLSAGFAALAINVSDRLLGQGCAALTTCAQPKDATSVAISIVNYVPSGSAKAVGPGTYSIEGVLRPEGGSLVSVRYATTDGSCMYTARSAVGGKVTIDSLSNGFVSGSYDVSLPGLAPVSGRFEAPDCSSQVPIQACSGSGSFEWPKCEGAATCQ